MTHTWQLEETKNKLSRVVENALNDGPQIITKRGVEVAVVLSYAEYERMLALQTEPVRFFPRVAFVGC